MQGAAQAEQAHAAHGASERNTLLHDLKATPLG
jgi:hypothetical protein